MCVSVGGWVCFGILQWDRMWVRMPPTQCKSQTPTRTSPQATGVGGVDPQGTLNSPGKKVKNFFSCVCVCECGWVGVLAWVRSSQTELEHEPGAM